jgi:hypothetical protein
LDFILSNCDILFISETWLLDSELFLFKNFNDNFILFHKSDMLFKPLHGRPYGGRLWFIKKNKFKNLSVEFYNERISVLTFNRFNMSFVLIGVYLPYFNNSNPNLFEFESSLILINELSDSFIKKNYTVILLSDFNCDLFRNNKFDSILNSFITQNNIQIIDNSFLNSDYTFSNSIYSCFIDHILIYNNKYISDFYSYIDHF